jgi:cyclophilin family peptidyl-prolyl cis-trans isomerase
MGYLDSHPSILKWSSEELAIPYFSPVDRRLHRYFPDFLIQKKDVKGTTSTVLVEVKPKNQTQPPKKKTRTTKKYINEVKTYAINEAKWKAALEYCKDRGWEFMIMTEKELGIK